jgi:prevent-host-death family protein
METLNVGELKKNFSDVLKKVKSGEEIIISFGKKNEKIAVIVPYHKYKSNTPRPLGLLEGKAICRISDNFQISDEELLDS